MYRLTKNRKEIAAAILDSYTKRLHDSRRIEVDRFEHDLRETWRLGYQELKDVMIDMVENHTEYAHLGAYYMEHSNSGVGVVTEFQEPLSKVYGLTSWYYDNSKDSKRDAYWARAFATISQFDLDDESSAPFLIFLDTFDQRFAAHFLAYPDELRRIAPRKFEELIAEMWDAFGYEVQLTQRTRDGGRDIIAVGNRRLAASRFLIECKRYGENNKVGVLPVRALYGVVESEDATKGILATTSSFSKDAKMFLDKHQWRLEGRDLDGVVEWLQSYQQIKFGTIPK